jgi:hypothetical protein
MVAPLFPPRRGRAYARPSPGAARTLLDYTNLYIRFGLGREFDPAHPTWRAYLAGLETTTDRREWTHRFYATRAEAMSGPAVVAASGCFAYALLPGDRIRLHFRNAEPDGHAPLAIDRLWGQFLDRRGEVREDAARPFLARLERQHSPEHLDDCFPLQVLSVEAPVEEFLEFYRI